MKSKRIPEHQLNTTETVGEALENEFQNHDLNLKRKENKEVLEISSTGYGLEAVSKETENEQNSNQTCGGL